MWYEFLLSGFAGALIMFILERGWNYRTIICDMKKLEKYFKNDQAIDERKLGDDTGFTPEYVRSLCFKSKNIELAGNDSNENWQSYGMKWKKSNVIPDL